LDHRGRRKFACSDVLYSERTRGCWGYYDKTEKGRARLWGRERIRVTAQLEKKPTNGVIEDLKSREDYCH